MSPNEREYHALISLLDDDDVEIKRIVEDKILSIGKDISPILKEFSLEDASSELGMKCEQLARKIHFQEIDKELNKWFQQKEGLLLSAITLLAKVKYPYLDSKDISFQVEKIVQGLWLRTYSSQSTFEQIQLINQTLFTDREIEVLTLQASSDEDQFFIHSILETQKSNAWGFCLLYIILAQAIDLPVYLAALPLNPILIVSKRWFDQSSLQQINLRQDILFCVNPLQKGITFSFNQIEDYLKKNNLDLTIDLFYPINNKKVIILTMENIIQTLDKNLQNDLSDLYRLLLKNAQ